MYLGNGWNLPPAVTRKTGLLDYLAVNHSESQFTGLPDWVEQGGTEAHNLRVGTGLVP